VESRDVLTGECLILRNRVAVNSMRNVLLRFDGDLREFKVIYLGQIVSKFPCTYIKGTNESVGGFLGKKQTVWIDTAFPDGNEFLFKFQTPDLSSFERLTWVIRQTNNEDEAAKELARLVKTRDKVSVKEVCGILSKHDLPDGFEDGKRRIETFITIGVADGIFDGETYVSKTTLQRETVSYNVAASFDFKDGVLQIKCPKCGAAIPLKNKESTGKCQYCGATYTVPTKILSLI